MFILKGNVMQTNKCAVIWSKNVHFVKTLPVPLLKKLYMFGNKLNQGWLDEDFTVTDNLE